MIILYGIPESNWEILYCKQGILISHTKRHLEPQLPTPPRECNLCCILNKFNVWAHGKRNGTQRHKHIYMKATNETIHNVCQTYDTCNFVYILKHMMDCLISLLLELISMAYTRSCRTFFRKNRSSFFILTLRLYQ